MGPYFARIGSSLSLRIDRQTDRQTDRFATTEIETQFYETENNLFRDQQKPSQSYFPASLDDHAVARRSHPPRSSRCTAVVVGDAGARAGWWWVIACVLLVRLIT